MCLCLFTLALSSIIQVINITIHFVKLLGRNIKPSCCTAVVVAVVRLCLGCEMAALAATLSQRPISFRDNNVHLYLILSVQRERGDLREEGCIRHQQDVLSLVTEQAACERHTHFFQVTPCSRCHSSSGFIHCTKKEEKKEILKSNKLQRGCFKSLLIDSVMGHLTCNCLQR